MWGFVHTVEQANSQWSHSGNWYSWKSDGADVGIKDTPTTVSCPGVNFQKNGAIPLCNLLSEELPKRCGTGDVGLDAQVCEVSVKAVTSPSNLCS